MKKSYIFVLLLLVSSFSFGQSTYFFDNFDSYTAGQRLACQNTTGWTTWSNLPCSTTEDPMVSSAQSSSPTKSVVIAQNNDLVKVLPNWTSGDYVIKFKNYIPVGKTGYFNVLQFFNGASSQWGFQAYFNPSGAGTVDAGGAASATFTWLPAVWVDVEVRVNVTTDAAAFYYNNVLVKTWLWSTGTFGTGTLHQLGGVNIFGALSTDEHYVDDFGVYNAVPVELTSFIATANNGAVTLNWSTATEINNRGFEVQRKSANSDFTTVAFINGFGTTTETQNYTFSEKVSTGKYSYRLRQVDFDGNYEITSAVEVDVVTPGDYMLAQNFPNPFNPATTFSFSLADAGMVKLSVYNLLGQEIQTLVNEFREAGNYEVTFNASNLPSGTYFYKIQTPQFNQTKKMTLSK